MYNTNQVFNNDNQIQHRKANYWRGFRACLILVVAPILITYIVFCNYIINQLG